VNEELHDDRFTATDVRALNRASIERSAVIARIAGTLAIAVAVIVAAGWLWQTVRLQQRAGGDFTVFDGSSTDIEFVDRVDVFIASLGLLGTAALVAGLGFGLRLVADYMQDRAGGTVTGFVAGDPLPLVDDAD